MTHPLLSYTQLFKSVTLIMVFKGERVNWFEFVTRLIGSLSPIFDLASVIDFLAACVAAIIGLIVIVPRAMRWIMDRGSSGRTTGETFQ